MTPASKRPIGFFVHHQGRGHAERVAAIVHALPASRPVTLFSARGDIFPALPGHAEIRVIPSLFEAPGPVPPALDDQRTPPTLHCAPLGWPTIRRAVAAITGWFDAADPALFVSDVSAEIAQLARIASVPAVKVLQHGQRDDIGHMAAYEGCVGLLAPYHEALEQADRPAWMREKTCYAGGIGTPHDGPNRAEARTRLGLHPARELVLVISGGGGSGAPLAPLTMGARAHPDALWVTIGPVTREWHETEVGNLRHQGWVENPEDWIAAADTVIASSGNTTVHMICAAGRPYLVVPEWRYFDEQGCKARALAEVGAAALRETWPASPAAWREALADAKACDRDAQARLVAGDGARVAADWLETLSARLWAPAPNNILTLPKAAE
ncbi:MAG: hypothetical protein AAF321_03085 [Pseudomonadota bacterium]